MASNLKQINARVTGEQLQTIKNLCKQLKISKADFIRFAIGDYVDSHGEDGSTFFTTPQHGGKRSK